MPGPLPPPPAGAASHQAKRHVFILDDDDAFREDLAECLILAGHEVIHSGDAAVLTSKGFCRIDTLILDLSMPTVDGTQVLRSMCDCALAPDVILVSGNAQDVIEAAAEAARMGNVQVVGALKKPFDPADLLQLLAAEPRRGAQRAAPLEGAPNAALMAGLEAALAVGAVPVAFQPQVHTETLDFAGAEVLLGEIWPGLGHVSAGAMIAAAASRPDLLTALTFHMVRAAAEGCAAWQTLGFVGEVSVNMPIETMLQPDVTPRLAALVRAAGVEPARVVFELTEDALYDSSSGSLMAVAQARLAGFGIALDDVGQRQSGLLQLARLPITELKIDRALLVQARTSEKARSIYIALVELGQRLALKVVAEGVETAQDLSFVKARAVDLVQGYLVSRKVPLADFLGLLKNWPQKQATLRSEGSETGGEDERPE